ncbi:phosphoribosylformylglycinamidine cyclo-ligase [Aeromicrobium sp.]|uniref:phosphoribosylformylglycinamidine cyclo-ligase n=1 Tax=Aeromicrobium sp. TaxID=1871063 RepID=UPI003513EA55
MTENAYARAGVDIEAADRAVDLMKEWVEKARRPEMLGGLGGFAGLFDASALLAYKRPLLATSTDGVGTKVAVAQMVDKHDTIGFDLVGMVVDDLVVCGAEPLFMTDYIATGKVVPERIAAIVKGIAEACVEAGCALVGGETAEHPGLLAPDEYDVAGATTGVVEADALLGPGRVRPGDVVLAMAASGLHSNGYSLARHVFFTQADWGVERHVDDFGRTLGEELLEPTRIYTKPALRLARELPAGATRAMAHITGGGLANNLARVMPAELKATLDRGTWTPGPVFDVVRRLGEVSQPDLEATLNCGVGMVAIVAPESVDAALALLADAEVPSWVVGEIAVDPTQQGSVELVGQHPGW